MSSLISGNITEKAHPAASGRVLEPQNIVAAQAEERAAVTDFPHSLIEFQCHFSDEAARAAYLFATRWRQGFVCLGCGTTKAWEPGTKPCTWEGAGCADRPR
jgi:hypothetical protein